MFVRGFEEIGIGDVTSVGGKGASLGEMTGAGLAVPPGFVVTTEAFRQFVSGMDPDGTIRREIEGLDAGDLETISKTSAAVRARIETAPMPDEIGRAIAERHAALCGAAADMPVAVRSSSTSEDSGTASFAGLQDTYLWLRGIKSVAHHVRTCWSSLYSVESVSYRRRFGVPELDLAMGVVVQRMVDSRCSGVMFTRSPATGDRSVIAIEGSYGLGSAIVSGEVTPDKFIVNKVTGEIVDRAISDKAVQHVPETGGGVRVEPVAADLRGVSCLGDAEIGELAQMGKTVERHYGRPQDIEWAVARGGRDMFLLQARPETVWAKRDAGPVTPPRASAVEHVFAAFAGKR